MNKLAIYCSMFVLLFICAGSTSKAALIFFDDFDSYNSGVPWYGGGNWTVIEASVDMIGVGTPWDLIPGNGRYVDTDGSTGNAGAIESIGIALAPGDYILSYDVAGNQRNSATDSFDVLVDSGSLVNYTQTAAGNAPFTKVTIPFTVSTATTATIIFDGAGNDNVGLLLDNVGLETVEVAIVPVPGAILLGAIGMACVGVLRKRRKL